MDLNEQTDVVADKALSPSATDTGTSSSDVTETGEEGLAEALAREFQQEFGDAETAEPAPESEQADESQTEEKAETAQTSEADDEESEDDFRIPDDEFQSLPPAVRKRVAKLSTKLKRRSQELQTIKAEMPVLQDRATRFDQIHRFTQENNITPENVSLMFSAAAMMSKGDYAGFMKAVQPFYDLAAQAAGTAIAPDLRERVDNGYLTEEDAKALTQARVQSQTYQAQAQHAQQQVDQGRQAQQQAAEHERIKTAVNTRQQQLQSADPDFARKLPAIMSMVKAARDRGAQFKTAEDAVAMLDQAYAALNAVTPARTAVPTPPRPSASTPPRGVAQPKNLQEHLQQALESMPQS